MLVVIEIQNDLVARNALMALDARLQELDDAWRNQPGRDLENVIFCLGEIAQDIAKPFGLWDDVRGVVLEE